MTEQWDTQDQQAPLGRRELQERLDQSALREAQVWERFRAQLVLPVLDRLAQLVLRAPQGQQEPPA